MRGRTPRKRHVNERVFGWASLSRLLRRRIQIQRYDQPAGALPPLHWSPCHTSTIHRFKATMTCPNGHVLTLRAHIVRPDGSVAPSVVCPVDDCAFHAYVRLSDWTFGLIR
jgi:hypothetical protein